MARRPSRSEREEYDRRSADAREAREAAAGELADVIAGQVRELVVDGDVMGGRELFVGRLQALLEAEKRGDRDALRSAVVDLGGACGAWAAALDFTVKPLRVVDPRLGPGGRGGMVTRRDSGV